MADDYRKTYSSFPFHQDAHSRSILESYIEAEAERVVKREEEITIREMARRMGPEIARRVFGVRQVCSNGGKDMEGIYGFKHRTNDSGREMFLEEMEDDHLMNNLNKLLDNLAKAKTVINGKEASGWARKTTPSRLTMDDAEEFFEFFMERYPFYLFEANLRGLDTDRLNQKLQAIMGREGSITVPETIGDIDPILLDGPVDE